MTEGVIAGGLRHCGPHFVIAGFDPQSLEAGDPGSSPG